MSRIFNPKVSIVIPVYNGSNYLKEAIDSGLCQTYENVEILVINDGSNDGGKTEKICKSYGSKIRYFKKENGGVASALNMGIEKMEGEYFSWLSHDDVYYPEKIEKQVNILSKLKNKKTIIFGGYEIIDQYGRYISKRDLCKIYSIKDLNKSLYPFFHLALNGCTMLIHKNHFKEFGNFNTGFVTTQDYDLWFRIFRNASIKYEEEILIKSRSHPEQGSKMNISTHIEECNDFWIKTLSDITISEIINLEGTEFNFYLNLYKSFKELTLYDEVIYYLEKKALEVIVSAYEKEEINLENTQDFINDRILEMVLNYPVKGKTNRILFFTGNWYDRGGLNRIISVVSSMLAKDFDVIVCCIKDSRNPDGYKLDEKVGFIEIEESDFLYLPRILKLLKVDVFIGSNNCFEPLLVLYDYIERLGIRTIMWNHENYFEPYYDSTFKNALGIRTEVYKKVSVVLWLSKVSAIVCRTFTDNVMVMENPLSISSLIADKKRNKSRNLIAIGRFNSPRKRIDRLLKVFGKISEKNDKVKLYILGQYDLNLRIDGKTVLEMIEEFSIPKDRIIFTGEVNNIEEYYSKASINIITAEREGFGLTVLEAASFRIPSVIFSSSGAAEILTDGVDGYIIDEGDIDHMAEMVLKLIDDKELYAKISDNAYSLSTKFTPEVVSKKWKDLISSILNQNKISVAELCKNDYLNYFGNDDELMKRAFLLYEGAINKQKEDILDEIHNSSSWKITKPIRKSEKLKKLINTQGFIVTIRNIISKLIKIR